MSTLEIMAAVVGAVTGWVFGSFIGTLHSLASRPDRFSRVERRHPYDRPEAA